MARQKFQKEISAIGFANKVHGRITDTSKDPNATSKYVVHFDGSKDYSEGKRKEEDDNDFLNHIATQQMDSEFNFLK